MSAAQPCAVWVTRPGKGAAVTRGVLDHAGYHVIAAPVLEVTTVLPHPPPEPPWPDWVVFVSVNAVEGLDAALDAPGFPEYDRIEQHQVRCAAVGRKTADKARAGGWHLLIVPEKERAEGLLEAFLKHDVRGRRVWIPSGNRAGSANRELPEGLEARGAIVEIFQVYETHDRPLDEADLARLDGATPGAIVVHSPSAAEAIYGPDAMPALARWRSEAVAVAIGPATRKRLENLGAFRIHECPEPSDDGILEVLSTIDTLRA